MPFRDEGLRAHILAGAGLDHDNQHAEEETIVFTTQVFDNGEQWELTTEAVPYDGSEEWMTAVITNMATSLSEEKMRVGRAR